MNADGYLDKLITFENTFNVMNFVRYAVSNSTSEGNIFNLKLLFHKISGQ